LHGKGLSRRTLEERLVGISEWLKIAWIVASAGIGLASAEGSELATFAGGPLLLGAFLWLFREHGWTTVLCAAVIAVLFFGSYFAE
jgi:hypothetical protein